MPDYTDISLISGILQGLLAAQEMQRREEQQQVEQERQNAAMQLQINQILFNREVQERQLQMEEEKLQMNREAFELGKKRDTLEYNIKENEFIANATYRGLQAGKTPEQIAQELSVTLNRPVTPQEVSAAIPFDAIIKDIGDLVKDFSLTAVKPEHVAQYKRFLYQKYGSIADHPKIEEALRSQLQIKAIENSSKTQTMLGLEKAKSDIETKNRLKLIQAETAGQVAVVRVRGAEERRTIGYKFGLEQRLAQQQERTGVEGATNVAQFLTGFQPTVVSNKLGKITDPAEIGKAWNKTLQDYDKYFMRSIGVRTSYSNLLQKSAELYSQDPERAKLYRAMYYAHRLGLGYQFIMANRHLWAGYDNPNFVPPPNFKNTIPYQTLHSLSSPLVRTIDQLGRDVASGVLTLQQAEWALQQAGLYEQRIPYAFDDGRDVSMPNGRIHHTGRFLLQVFIDTHRRQLQNRPSIKSR